MSVRRRSAGFSLLEVLAAFVILALVATALFRLFSGSLANASAAEEWSRALLLAESQLDLAASTQPLKESTERGNDSTGNIQWETRVVAYTPPDTNPDARTRGGIARHAPAPRHDGSDVSRRGQRRAHAVAVDGQARAEESAMTLRHFLPRAVSR